MGDFVLWFNNYSPFGAWIQVTFTTVCNSIFLIFQVETFEITMSVEEHVVLDGEDHNKTQVFWIAVPKEYEK